MPQRSARARALENRRFLKQLAISGNLAEAARACGLKQGTLLHRRRSDPIFAQGWEAALAMAQAALVPQARQRWRGGAQTVTRGRGGRLQVQRTRPGRCDRAGEQRFLLALSATANIKLSAQAAGFTPATFYRRAKSSPAFAREWREALAQGHERVEQALLGSFEPASYADDAWRHNEPPALPPMTADQALRLLAAHTRTAVLLQLPGTIRKRRGESRDVHRYRLQEMVAVREQRERDRYTIAEAERQACDGLEEGEAPIVLPDLGVVSTGSG